jgi:hypothetical protein
MAAARSGPRLEQLGHPLRRHVEHLGNVPPSKARPLRLPGCLTRLGGGPPLGAVGIGHGRPGRPGLLVQAAADLWSDHHIERIIRHAEAAPDQVAGHHLGIPEAARLGDPNAVDVQFPAVLPASPAVALGAVGTDAIFACPALTVDQSVSKYVPTYAYEFNDENAPERFLPPVSFPYGAAHASELQYLFGLLTAVFPGLLSPPQEQLAAAMKQDWTSFATRGFPTSSAAPRWPRFDTASQRMLSLIPPQPSVETGFAAGHHCAFWALAG